MFEFPKPVETDADEVAAFIADCKATVRILDAYEAWHALAELVWQMCSKLSNCEAIERSPTLNSNQLRVVGRSWSRDAGFIAAVFFNGETAKVSELMALYDKLDCEHFVTEIAKGLEARLAE